MQCLQKFTRTFFYMEVLSAPSVEIKLHFFLLTIPIHSSLKHYNASPYPNIPLSFNMKKWHVDKASNSLPDTLWSVQLFTEKWKDIWRKGTHKHLIGLFRLSQMSFQSEDSKCMWTHGKGGAIFTMCSHTFTLFWSKKTSVIVEICQLSFHVFVCAFPPKISSFHSKSFTFFPIFCVICTLVLSFPHDLFNLLWLNCSLNP